MRTVDRPKSIISALKKDLLKAKEAANYWELLANTDDLTGLCNRRKLHDVDKCIAEKRETTTASEVTLLFIDLDNFGQLNKKYGDDVGDDALRLLGAAVRKNIRATDIAIRKGGDEFVIILIGTTPDQANNTVVQRLALMLDGELYLNVKDDIIPIKGSIGVFPYNLRLTPLDNLKQADELMRTQKMARKAAKIIETPLLIPAPNMQTIHQQPH